MRFCGWSAHVYICKTRAHLWMEMKICEGELAVENRVTYLLMKPLRCEWEPYTYERDHSRVNGTTRFWTKPVDYQFTNGGPIHIWRSNHTMRYRLHVEDHGQPIPTCEGISTCDRVFHVWTGHVYVNGSCICEGPSTREQDIHVWMERDVYLWMDFRQTS